MSEDMDLLLIDENSGGDQTSYVQSRPSYMTGINGDEDFDIHDGKSFGSPTNDN